MREGISYLPEEVLPDSLFVSLLSFLSESTCFRPDEKTSSIGSGGGGGGGGGGGFTILWNGNSHL